MDVCCIKGCEKPVIALGLCVNHWRRNRKYGSPAAYKSHSGLFRGMPPEQRFWKQVKKTDSCWLWAGPMDRDGYGIFRGAVAGVIFSKAHRFSYALHTGDLLHGMQALHTCDNPRCVNPSHLFSGTNADNMADKVRKGRSRAPAGEHHHGVVLTELQVKAILKDPRPHAQISVDYGVMPSTIGSIKQKVSWKHLEESAVHAPRVGQQGEKFYAAKLKAEDVLFIRASNLRGKDLALRFGVSPQTITDIRKFRSWTHISTGDTAMSKEQ